MNNKVV